MGTEFISDKQAIGLVGKLSSTIGFPQRDEGEAELASTLKGCAASFESAKALIDDWLRDRRYCPTPADIRRLARQQQHPVQGWQPDRSSCALNRCDGHGWIYTDGPAPHATRCECGASRQTVSAEEL